VRHVLCLSQLKQAQRFQPVLPVQIGITFEIRSVAGAFPLLQTPSKNIAITNVTGWAKDYADALTFFAPVYLSGSILPTGNSNLSLVGLTPQQAKAVGVKGTVTGIPSVDADVARCAALVGASRLRCWEGVDRRLSTKIVPSIPYLWRSSIHIVGKDVTQWGYDQFSATTAWAHVAVR
jgi:hypothetical protein